MRFIGTWQYDMSGERLHGPLVSIMSFGAKPTAIGSYHPRCLPRRTALISSVLFSTIIAGSWGSRPTNETLAGALQLTDTSGQSYFANAHPYLEEPLAQLVGRIPELKTLQPAPDQQALPMILGKTGKRVKDLMQDMVDLVAQEEVTLLKLKTKGAIKSSQHFRYSYLILPRSDEFTLTLQEYRTDLHGNRVEQEGLDKGYFLTSGFALSWLHFHPDVRSDSTFRYLGDEALGSRSTYVVAFAQHPGQASIIINLKGEWGAVPILVQGIAWLDKNSFQIVRMRTDLLGPRSDIDLVRDTTEETFSEVHIKEIAIPFWLPSEVDVYIVFKGHAFRNEHRYTNYERFRVYTKIR